MFGFQLFDDDNPVNKLASRYIFSTEGHILPVNWKEQTDSYVLASDAGTQHAWSIVDAKTSNDSTVNVSKCFILLLAILT